MSLAVTASQFVLEEKIMERHSVDPLLAAGYEGTSGLITTLAGLFILNAWIGSKPAGRGGYFDAKTGWHQIIDNPPVFGSSILIAFSIACFNGSGLAVTKIISATARSTIDSCRTLGIWMISLMLGWEQFKSLQVVGFALLVYGTFVFNGITTFPRWTGLHLGEDVPAIVLPAEEESLLNGADGGNHLSAGEDSDIDEYIGRSRAVDAFGRPVTRRSGSGRRGEVSPLLKNVDE
ncbi:hypothetical protein OIO90_000094 [Microbotryomycetes sp. JL221]|nr:hypothetical protein OIO90_000094 [Microbotryomycetes sp. JL221]